MTANPTRASAVQILGAAALLAAAQSSHALVSVNDAANDFLPTFGGSTSSLDLDVLDATVTFNTVANTFTLSSTQAGAVGSTATGFYVWGVDRGAGTAGFASSGITGVFFDTVVILRPNGTGTAAGVPLPVGAITVAGNVISATFSASMLASTGFAVPKYTWNLWPRDSAAGSGFAQISDFAPNNASFTAAVVPEPGSLALILAGVTAIALRRRHAQHRARHNAPSPAC
jgi:hypothetical protein